MANGNLRTHLEFLEERGLFKWVHAEVDAKWEIESVVYLLDQTVPIEERVAIGFDRIKGFPEQRVATGVIAGTPRLIRKRHLKAVFPSPG